jgi:hypothetical protein
VNRVLRTLIVAVCLVSAASAQRTPEVSLSDKAADGFITVHGVGFSPRRYAISHLRKPDETEYHVRRFLTDAQGEFFHRIDTAILDPGTHELWVEDEDSKVLSNKVRFEVKH